MNNCTTSATDILKGQTTQKFKKMWDKFEEELRYRIGRAQNEPIDDMEWFIECSMKELTKLAREAVSEENKCGPKHC